MQLQEETKQLVTFKCIAGKLVNLMVNWHKISFQQMKGICSYYNLKFIYK